MIVFKKKFLISLPLRKDESEWRKYIAQQSKRQSLVHVLDVQHQKEQNAKGAQLLCFHLAR